LILVRLRWLGGVQVSIVEQSISRVAGKHWSNAHSFCFLHSKVAYNDNWCKREHMAYMMIGIWVDMATS